jgi:coproporphyrinogen III oxidase
LVATLDHVAGSRYRFTDDLDEAHGPWFGGPFGATPFMPRKVDAATFASADLLNATLDHGVDGTPSTSPSFGRRSGT